MAKPQVLANGHNPDAPCPPWRVPFVQRFAAQSIRPTISADLICWWRSAEAQLASCSCSSSVNHWPRLASDRLHLASRFCPYCDSDFVISFHLLKSHLQILTRRVHCGYSRCCHASRVANLNCGHVSSTNPKPFFAVPLQRDKKRDLPCFLRPAVCTTSPRRFERPPVLIQKIRLSKPSFQLTVTPCKRHILQASTPGQPSPRLAQQPCCRSILTVTWNQSRLKKQRHTSATTFDQVAGPAAHHLRLSFPQ